MVRNAASHIATLASGLAVLALTGCASLNAIDTDVSSFSKWPAGRAPATYAFERLPSQSAEPTQAQTLEDAARMAVEGAGFVAAAPGAAPDVTVQIGARITPVDRSPFDDPLWYGAGPFYRPFYYGGRYGRSLWGAGWGPGWGPGWRYGYASWNDGFPYYEREVAVLIRDKVSGEALFEARANSDGSSWDTSRLLPAMFSAALKDFPAGVDGKPHRVRTQIGGETRASTR